MGWIRRGADDHEGWVANVLIDGRVGAGSTAGGVIVHELTADDVTAGRKVFGSVDLDVVVPWDQVATWRVVCECGWTGVEMPARDDPDPDPRWPADRDCPEDIQERDFFPAWEAHVAPFAALTDLEELLEQLHTVETLIAGKVALARTGGASWTQVGRATGVSKQGAQQRWGQQQGSPQDPT